MERGEQRFKAYVERSVRGTKFDVEPVRGLNTRADEGFGTEAVQVFASDLAIHRLGADDGDFELQRLDAHRGLPQVIAAASKRVYARINVDANGHLFVEKPDV